MFAKGFKFRRVQQELYLFQVHRHLTIISNSITGVDIMVGVTEVTQEQPKKPLNRWIHTKNTGIRQRQVSFTYFIPYLAFADLNILFRIQRLNGRP